MAIPEDQNDSHQDPQSTAQPEEKNKTQQDPQTTAQLEKLQLEIADLRWKVRWVYKVAQVTSIIVAIVAVFAFLWNLYQFNDQQRRNAQMAEEAKKKEADAVDRELKKPVRERQLAITFEISNIAATIAARPPEDEERKKAETRFRELYMGPRILLEDKTNIYQKMIEFVDCLDKKEPCDSESWQSWKLEQLSQHLTNRCRGGLGLAWDIEGLDSPKDDNPVPP